MSNLRIAFLACAATMPGAQGRRVDAFEHDQQIAALRAGLAGRAQVIDIDWRAPLAAFDGIALAIIGSTWDYWDHLPEFLERLDMLAARGIAVCNSPETVRWNCDKGYLAQLGHSGVAAIPTQLHDNPGLEEIAAALDHFGCERVVVKRRVGAGAHGQFDFTRAALPAPDWRMGHRALVQPFVPAIVEEGEYSMIFIDGAFSHALLKQARAGDYRVQSMYGGQNRAIIPAPADIAAAEAIMAALPVEPPLYARIDLVRGADGALCLMEAELIEPFLYPLEGPDLGPRLAEGILKRLA